VKAAIPSARLPLYLLLFHWALLVVGMSSGREEEREDQLKFSVIQFVAKPHG